MMHNTTEHQAGANQDKKPTAVNENGTPSTNNGVVSDISEGLDNLNAIDKYISEKSARSNFRLTDIKPGETKIWQFDPKRIRKVPKEFKQKDEKTGQETVVTQERVEYDILDINNPAEGWLKKDFAFKWASLINAQLREGFRILKVTRTGTSKQDTSYTVAPVFPSGHG